MVVTLSGMVTLVRRCFESIFPMVVTLLPMVTLVRALCGKHIPNGRDAVWNGHAGEAVDRKAQSPMVVTLSGMVTLVRR